MNVVERWVLWRGQVLYNLSERPARRGRPKNEFGREVGVMERSNTACLKGQLGEEGTKVNIVERWLF